MPFIGLFFGNRIGIVITTIVLLSGAFFTWLALHDHVLWNKATDSFNQMQELIFQQKQEQFQQQSTLIDENAMRIRRSTEKQQQIDMENANSIEKQAIVETKGAINPSSPYLKSIIKQLDSAYGEKKK